MNPADPERNAIGPTSALAELDDVLERLLRRELETAGIEGVAISLEAPDRERTAGWPSPALNLFLYDVRESELARDRSWQRSHEGHAILGRSPMRLDCMYAITAWTRAITDEHRLLSQVLAILLAYPELPVELLPADLLVGNPPVPVKTRIAHRKDGTRADFWNAIGSPYKVSLEYEVTILISSAQRRAAGPPARRSLVTTADPYLTRGAIHGGTVRRRDGSPAVGAVVIVASEGVAAVVDTEGRFRLTGLAGRDCRAQVRDVDGVTAWFEIPASPDDLDFQL